jgi:hypothetical protein
MKDEFQDVYETWIRAASPEEKAVLEEYLNLHLEDAWAGGGADSRKLVLHFIHHIKHFDADLIVAGLRDSDTQVGAIALSMLALFISEGVELDQDIIVREIDSFSLRHPEWRNVCNSVRRRLENEPR